ncbi:MAG: type II toxin-antitoxin system RelE/ParE family toxin [Hyphomonadaceae bacterium]|nr:type II toxin-antitoxin system RelE/ParE family toxin [Hyphomonadaceae bacterium]
MKLRWRKAALAELDEAAYIAQDNPRAAAQLVQRIAYAAEGLLTFPRMGRPIDDSGFLFRVDRTSHALPDVLLVAGRSSRDHQSGSRSAAALILSSPHPEPPHATRRIFRQPRRQGPRGLCRLL